jgi:hypothetical protein
VSEVVVEDVIDLWRAGVVMLPNTAIQYVEMARELHASAVFESGAFRNPNGAMGPLHPVWTKLRDIMQDTVAVKSRDRLVAAGEALRRIAESYATTDQLSATDLEKWRRVTGGILDVSDNPDPALRPPDGVPAAPSTGDPHPIR